MAEITGAIFDPKNKTQEQVVDEIMTYVEVLKQDYERRKAEAIAAKKAREAKGA
jgi:hypothetical protein